MAWIAALPTLWNAVSGKEDKVGKASSTTCGFYDPTGENQTGYDASKWVLPTHAGNADKYGAIAQQFLDEAMAPPQPGVGGMRDPSELSYGRAPGAPAPSAAPAASKPSKAVGLMRGQ